MPVSRDTITLPLIPVQAVLYPGMRLDVTVADDRYRRLVADCMEHDTPLGIVLAKGTEASSTATEPHSIGTTARILQSRTGDDGQLRITVVGIGRFQLLSYRQGARVLIGQARFAPDNDDRPGPRLVDEAYALASEYFSTADPSERWTIPGDPETLSYSVAQRLPLSLADQQELLEQRSLVQRLGQEVMWLRTLLDQLRTMPRPAS